MFLVSKSKVIGLLLKCKNPTCLTTLKTNDAVKNRLCKQIRYHYCLPSVQWLTCSILLVLSNKYICTKRLGLAKAKYAQTLLMEMKNTFNPWHNMVKWSHFYLFVAQWFIIMHTNMYAHVYSNKHKTPPEATIFLVNTQKLFNEVLLWDP